MAGNKGGAIKTGDIKGVGIAVGHGSRASVTLAPSERTEILALLDQFRAEVRRAALPDHSKGVLIDQAAREVEEATREPDPKPKIEGALAKANIVLESVGATAEQAAGLLESLRKIAAAAGIALGTVAPFAAKLLGV